MSLKKTSILFDCDGVLVDTEIMAARVVVRELAKVGVELDIHQYMKEFSGRKDTEIIAHFQEVSKGKVPKDFFHTIEKGFDRAYETELEIIPGAESLLASIQIPKAVVSNSSLQRLSYALNATKLIRFFDPHKLYSAEFVPKPKPDPDIYLWALQQTGFDRESTIAIEDSFAGVTAAVAAGLTVLGFCGASHIQEGHAEKLLQIGAFATAKTMDELGRLIQDLT